MKLKKIISAISAFAMIASMVTVANAASLGGKPVITAEFKGYEKKSETAIFAYVDITMDMTPAETLVAFEEKCDDSTGWETVTVGNGIQALGITWSIPSGWGTYNASLSTKPAGLTYAGTTITLGAKEDPNDYYTTPVTKATLAYKITDLSASGNITFDANLTDMKGCNSAEDDTIWSYYGNKDQITLTGCTIPSYNEWSTPVTPDPVAALSIEVAEGHDKDAGYAWALDITKAADTAINGFKAEFTTGTESTERNLDAKNVGLLNSCVAEGTGATRVWVGLKTAKEVTNATFTVTDAANATVSDSWK